MILLVLLPFLSRSTFVLSFDSLALIYNSSFIDTEEFISNEGYVADFLSSLLGEMED